MPEQHVPSKNKSKEQKCCKSQLGCETEGFYHCRIMHSALTQHGIIIKISPSMLPSPEINLIDQTVRPEGCTMKQDLRLAR